MATIHEVARAARVSPATISRVLLRPELVAEKTRLRVQEVIDTLGYKPNPSAASLRTLRTGKIVVSVPDISNPFFSSIVRGIGECAQNNGYSVLLGDTRGDRAREEGFAALLDSRMADGLIFLGHRLPDAVRDTVMREGASAPIVNACEFSPELGVSSVHIDNRLAAREAVQVLCNLGHRNIGVITGDLESPLSRDRLQGAREAVEGRSDVRLTVVSDDFSIESGRRQTLELVRSVGPTAIFCFSDEMAIGTLAALRALKLDCPGDVSVMGFDDIDMAKYAFPALTTIRQPMLEIGKLAAELMFDILARRQADLRCVTLPHELVVRDSIGRAP
jgi:LacI family repressor for deo operon, udp, cdd, tsx, nupC, and nupG